MLSATEPKMSTKQNNFKYNLLFVRTGELREVSLKRFSSLKGVVFVYGFNKIRVIGEIPRARVKSVLNEYFAQAGFGPFSDLFNMISGTFSSLSSFASKVNKRFLLLVSKLFIELLSFSDLVHGKRVDQIVCIFLSLYSLVDHFQAQALDSWILAGLSTLFPPALNEVIKKASMFSNVKLLDDVVLVQQFLSAVNLFVVGLCDLLCVPQFLKDKVVVIMDVLSISSKHLTLSRVKDLLFKFDKNNKVVADYSFRTLCSTLSVDVQQNLDLLEWRRRSGSFDALMVRFDHLMKIVRAYDQTDRVEPNTFVFQGPPGVYKSVLMCKLIELLGWPSYSHLVPSVDSGKDFYDSYNNEEVFFMDDVGQEGVSQWRTIMNMHSCVKMPLPCADAKLKDTKFFNSGTILLTTNRFTNLNGLVKSDCIDNLEALWRRGYVFDFSNVVRNLNTGNLTGNLVFLHYDLKSKMFVNQFPKGFSKYCNNINVSLSLNFDNINETMDSILVWMGSIVVAFKNIKEDYAKSLILVSDRRKELRDLVMNNTDRYVDCFEPQGLFCDNWLSEVVISYFTDFIREFFVSVSNIFYKYEKHLYIIFAIMLVLLVSHLFVTSSLMDKGDAFEGQSSIFSKNFSTVHNSIQCISKNVFHIDVMNDNGFKVEANCLISGRTILLPCHLVVGSEVTIRVYRNRKDNHILIDFTRVKVIFENSLRDICLLKLPKTYCTPFPNLSRFFTTKEFSSDKTFLISCDGFVDIGTCKRFDKVKPYSFSIGPVVKRFQLQPDYVSYDVQMIGLCGSIVFSPGRGFIGMHVAGNPLDNVGVSTYFNDDIRQVLSDYFESDKDILPIGVSDKSLVDVSVVKLDKKIFTSSSNVSNFKPSLIYGVYPVTRFPADLGKYGKMTIKEIVKKSFSSCAYIKPEEINFGVSALSAILANFSDLSDYEVIKGTEFLAGLNKDSSNGYLCAKEKNYYIDFENGCPTAVFSSELEEFQKHINNDCIDYEKLFWVETLKDELRNVEKDGVPRSFRIGTIHQQFLVKRLFGNMVTHIIQNRSFNKILIGCNPIKEWDFIYKDINTGKSFAGDIKNWDGAMNSLVQQAVVDLLLTKYIGPNPKMAQVLLSTLCNSLVVVKDDLFLTTHSMPSGSFLTAIFNSLVNKFYTAIWYYRMVSDASVYGFWNDLSDYVYGDDKLVVVKDHFDVLNALTMKEFFVSIGLNYTTADKKEVVTAFDRVEDLTLLKRSFRFHKMLGKIVCPLELRTIFSSLSFVDDSKDCLESLNGKILAAQREFYLHEDFEFLLADFHNRMSKFNISYNHLTYDYLYSIFSDDNFVLPLSFGGNCKYL